MESFGSTVRMLPLIRTKSAFVADGVDAVCAKQDVERLSRRIARVKRVLRDRVVSVKGTSVVMG